MHSFEQYKNISIEMSNNIAVVKLNRPQYANAMDNDTLIELAHAIESCDNNTDIRGIILTASGDKAFCAGGDIKKERFMTPEQAVEFDQYGCEAVEAILKCKKPIVAAVYGFVLGGAISLMLACDLAVAAENSIFGIPTITLGSISGWGSIQLLNERIGLSATKRMILTGEKIDINEAYRIGMVDYKTSCETLMEKTFEVIESITKNSTNVVKETKAIINHSVDLPYEKSLKLTQKGIHKCIASGSFKEGTDAFFEKREPRFT